MGQMPAVQMPYSKLKERNKRYNSTDHSPEALVTFRKQTSTPTNKTTDYLDGWPTIPLGATSSRYTLHEL